MVLALRGDMWRLLLYQPVIVCLLLLPVCSPFSLASPTYTSSPSRVWILSETLFLARSSPQHHESLFRLGFRYSWSLPQFRAPFLLMCVHNACARFELNSQTDVSACGLTEWMWRNPWRERSWVINQYSLKRLGAWYFNFPASDASAITAKQFCQ